MGCCHSDLYNTRDYIRLVEINDWFKKEFPGEWKITEEDIKILSIDMNVITYFLDTFVDTRKAISLFIKSGSGQKTRAHYAVVSTMSFNGHQEIIWWTWRLDKLRENFRVIGDVVNSKYTRGNE